MNFEKDHIYHIYNQGNNRRKIFFNRENYLFFLKKIVTYVLPYGDILAWCLMPNHFHFMVMVREVELPRLASQGLTLSQALTVRSPTTRSLNDSIGIVLRSYTRAINKQEKQTGSLFRKNTKAECITCPDNITPSWYMQNGTTTYINTLPENDYPIVCFNYIHENPVAAGLVKQQTDWEFSSAKDYAGHRNGNLINKKIAKKFGLYK